MTIKIETIHGDTIELIFDGKAEIIKESEPEKQEYSVHARWFDDSCIGWSKDAVYNKMYLMCQQNYMNDLLRTKGHLFVNDVYDALGMARTEAGQVVGWIYEEGVYVDFGLTKESNWEFMNGYSKIALLDFNDQGNILDRI